MFGKTTHPLVWTSLKLFHFVYSSLRYVTKMFCVLIWTWSFQNNIGKGKLTRFMCSIKSWTGSFERARLESNGYEIYQNAKWRYQVRVVTKISSCRVNTTSRRGIKQVGIFLVIFFLALAFATSWQPCAKVSFVISILRYAVISAFAVVVVA